MANQFANTGAGTAAVALLKPIFKGPVVSQFNDMLPFWKNIEKGTEKYSGLNVTRALKVLRNNGIGATSDGGVLPAIGTQTTVQATITAALNYLRFGVTGPMIKSSQSDQGSFVRMAAYEIEEGLKDLKSDCNRQLQWDGTGDLAVVSATAIATNSITATGRESTEAGNKFLQPGIVIDIINAAGTAYSAQAVTVNAISMSGSTATLTLNMAVSVTSTDIIIRSGALNNEIKGVLTWLDGGTTTVNGVSRSTYPAYQGNVINAAGGQLTLNLMQQALNAARQYGGGEIDFIDCDFDSERYLTKLYVADKRYIGAKVMGDGSFTDKNKSYLEFAGSAVSPDKDCPTRFFFLDSSTWKKYVLCELEWADESGSEMIVQPETDAFEQRLRFFAQLFCDKPSANAALRNYISP